MKILGIETSCDETAASVATLDNGSVKIFSNVLATSMDIHAKTGGIIPEDAARNQIKFIIPVISEALEKAGITFSTSNPPEIDALAITYGPGLIGSLLVGVETVKTLSYIWNKPIIPVNHLFGHIYANFIDNSPLFPLITLIVSGGHTDLLYMKSHTEIKWLGGTRDDAAGEAFDKIGRLLGLNYPAGPLIEQHAKNGNPKAYHFPRPLMYDKAYDFSFSGLKTAALREVEKIRSQNKVLPLDDICRGVQNSIIDVLTYKAITAAKEYQVSSLLLSGGVAANQTLKDTMAERLKKENLQVKLYVPQRKYCTDNGAMIASAAFFRNTIIDSNDLTANPELYFD